MQNIPRDRQRCCIIMPAYMEEKRIGKVVRQVKQYIPDIVVIDDGSTDRTNANATDAGAVVIRHENNRGKGTALNTGFQYARENGYDYMITMDADGQHDPADIPAFVEAYQRTGIPILIGNRMTSLSNMPLIRKWTNRFMSWLLSHEMRQYVPDTQCGFRLYRCDEIPFISTESTRYAAESEILLHIAARGIRIDAVPISVIYGTEKSKINPVRDTIRFFIMLYRHRRHLHQVQRNRR